MGRTAAGIGRRLVFLFALAAPVRAAGADLVIAPEAEGTVEAEVNGVILRLKVQLEQEGAILLNPDAAARAGLGQGEGKMIMAIGPVSLSGRFANSRVVIAGRKVSAQIAWYDRDAVAGADGLISPGLLPFYNVVVGQGAREGVVQEISFRTRFDKDQGIHLPLKAGRKTIAVRFSLERERTTAPAAAAAVLAAVQGGALSETSARAEVGYGVSRPVRELCFDRPLPVGALSIAGLWVRVLDFRGSHKLPLVHRAQGSNEIVVEGVPASQKSLYRVTLGRDALRDCFAFTYERQVGKLSFRCLSR